MELEGIRLDLSNSLEEDIQSIVVSSDCFSQVKKTVDSSKNLKKLKASQVALVKNSSFKTNYIILVNFADSLRLELMRRALFNCFKKIKKHKIKSVAFLVAGFRKNINLGIFSKIAAQELFRYSRCNKKRFLKRVLFIADTDKSYKTLKKNVFGYLNHIKTNKGPFLTVDAIINYQQGIVLIERTNPPLGWALPGGFVDYQESLEAAVVREAKEETGLDFENIKQFRAYSDNSRDPRFHTVSVVFTGRGKGKLKAASDAKSAFVFKIKAKNPLKNLPSDIAFDHRKILKDFIKSYPKP